MQALLEVLAQLLNELEHLALVEADHGLAVVTLHRQARRKHYTNHFLLGASSVYPALQQQIVAELAEGLVALRTVIGIFHAVGTIGREFLAHAFESARTGLRQLGFTVCALHNLLLLLVFVLVCLLLVELVQSCGEILLHNISVVFGGRAIKTGLYRSMPTHRQ